MNALRIAFLLLALPVMSAMAEWPRFRGPNGSGVSKDVVPVQFTDANLRWKVRLPEEGHGSPVVWGTQVYVTCASHQTAEQQLLCLDTRDGSVKWKKQFSSEPHHLHKFNHYGTTTPAVDADHVYTYWASEKEVKLAAFTHAGKEVWRVDLGTFTSSHGGGTSPMVYKDLVVITNDQVGESFLLAVNKSDGRTRWKIPRKNMANGTAYAVPCVYEEAGQAAQLIFTSRANGMTGVDPESGKVLWEITDLFPLRVVFSPVVAGELVVSGCGQGGGGKLLVAVRPGSADGSRKPEVVYTKKRALPYVPAPLVVNGLLFTVNDSTGVASCYDAASGEEHWQERLEGQQFFGSPVCAGDHIYAISKSGDVVVFKAARAFERVATNPLGELSYATPAVANGAMYLRSLNHLLCVGSN